MRLILRFFSSLRLGIVLIALLTVACIYGSVLASDESRGVDYARAYVFHTPWFLGLMGLLLFNLVLCSWEKSYIALTLYQKRNTVAGRGFYAKARHGASMPWRGGLESVASLLRRRYTVTRRKGNAFYAQRGLFGRCGATIIHIGLIWTMAAGFYRILADDFGWGVFDSTIILPEGETTASFFSRIDRLKNNTQDNLRERRLPFTIRALDFTAEYYPHSTVARHFASLVELRDGDHVQISEVTMRQPLLYNGYKITQNSFSENQRVIRGRFLVRDVRSGESVELDAGPGDPVKLAIPGVENPFFQINELAPGAEYHVMDLAQRRIIESGVVQTQSGEMPSQHDTERVKHELATSKYSFMAAALFPNFRINENNEPTTLDDQFDNPAVFIMLFKNGAPNGYAWLFLDPQAQEIIGQPHPELEMRFVSYRKKTDRPESGSLHDYELEIRLSQKQPPKDLGTFHVVPGVLQEIESIDPEILDQPNATIKPGHRAGDGQHPSLHGGTGDAAHQHGPLPEGGAGQPMAAGGQPAGSAAASSTAPDPQFEVLYLGRTGGHVTFLGFMKDPSVGWIFSGCIIIVFGTIIAFAIPYREVWIWFDEEEQTLRMATAVRGTSPSSHREFDRLVDDIAQIAGEQYAAESAPEAEPAVLVD